MARVALNEALRKSGATRTDSVARALGAVPRELFVPLESRDAAYRDDAVVLKRDHKGAPISSVSQPTMVAVMLELLEIHPGDRVLEVGTGSGYNAALLSLLVGGDGVVVTIEIENDLAARARSLLRRLGLGRVEIVVGDGVDGYQRRAPYDGIIVTAGVRDVAPEWGRQLSNGGRLVVPLTGEDGVGEVVAFVKRDRDLLPVATSPCAFLPIRDSATNT